LPLLFYGGFAIIGKVTSLTIKKDDGIIKILEKIVPKLRAKEESKELLDFIDSLARYGLGKSAARIYVYLLSYGPQRATEIYKRLVIIPRTGIYRFLNELISLGLIRKTYGAEALRQTGFRRPKVDFKGEELKDAPPDYRYGIYRSLQYEALPLEEALEKLIDILRERIKLMESQKVDVLEKWKVLEGSWTGETGEGKTR